MIEMIRGQDKIRLVCTPAFRSEINLKHILLHVLITYMYVNVHTLHRCTYSGGKLDPICKCSENRLYLIKLIIVNSFVCEVFHFQ